MSVNERFCVCVGGGGGFDLLGDSFAVHSRRPLDGSCILSQRESTPKSKTNFHKIGCVIKREREREQKKRKKLEGCEEVVVVVEGGVGSGGVLGLDFKAWC